MATEDVKLLIMAAMLDSSRGIGYNAQLPWPSLSKDVEMLIRLTTTTTDTDKKNIIIHGRLSWQNGFPGLKTNDKIVHIVMSTTLKEVPMDCYIAKDFNHAIEISRVCVKSGEVENVWVFGGENIFKKTIASPLCHRIHLTRVYADFPADTYFPPFEEKYQLISNADERQIQEDNGIQFRFEIYSRK